MNPTYDQWVEDHGGYEIFRVRGGFIAKNDDGDCIEDVCSVSLKKRIDERNHRRGLI